MQEENLRSGLLLEQGALCLLRTRPPRLRKFAFHMTLAGLRFNACDQKALGARAYRWAQITPSGTHPAALSALQSPKVYWGLEVCTACSLKLCSPWGAAWAVTQASMSFPCVVKAGLLRLHAKQGHMLLSQLC